MISARVVRGSGFCGAGLIVCERNFGFADYGLRFICDRALQAGICGSLSKHTCGTEQY